MSKKEKIQDLISNLKKQAKNKTIPETTMAEALTKALVHPIFRERDMKQDAIDLGAHGAKDIWGKK